MKNLINYLKTLWGAWGNLQSKDVRHDCRLTVGSPSGMTAKLQVNSFMRFAVVLTLIFAIGSGNVWGAKHSMTPDASTSGSSSTSYLTTLTEFTCENPTGSSISWKMNQWNPSSLQIKTNQSSAASEFRFYNTSAFAGKVTKVVITFSALTVSYASKLMFLGGSSEVTATTGGTAGTWNSSAKTLTWTPGSATDYTFFAFYQNGKAASGTNKLATSNAIVVYYLTKVTLDKNGGTSDGKVYFDDNATAASVATGYTFSAATRTGYTCTGYYTATSGGTKVLNADGTFAAATVSGYISSEKWTYAGGTLKLYAQWTSAASCTTPPGVGASSHSSITSTSAVVTCASVDIGDCDIDEWGFVYGTSTAPTGNAIKKGESSSTDVGEYSHTITGLTPSTKYYVRGYAKVGGNTYYGAAETSFTTSEATRNTITLSTGTGSVSGGGWSGSAGTYTQQQASVGASITLPSATPSSACTALGWTFAGWKLGSAQGETTSAPTLVAAETSVTPDADVTYYAVYKMTEGGGSGAAVNTVLYYEPFTGFTDNATPTTPGSGATVYSSATITYANNNGTTQTSKVTTANGGNLAGGDSPEYMIGKNNGSFVVSGIPNGDAEKLTVSYRTNAKSCTVTTGGTDYSGTTTTSTTGAHEFDVTVGTDATFSLTFTAASDNVRLDNIEVKVKTAGSSGTTTWTSSPACEGNATVTYNANGATSGTAPTDSNSPYDLGASVTVLGNTGNLTKTGLDFGGWNTAADGSGITYQPGATFTIKSNTTLYAKWVTLRTVTLIDNGHSTNVYVADGETYSLPDEGESTCEDATLLGWATGEYTNHATGTDVAPSYDAPGASKTISANTTFVAVYGTVTEDASDEYTKISSLAELKTGDYLIGGMSSPYCMSNSVSDSHMTERTMSQSNNKITNTYTDIIWHITKTGDNYTFYNAAADKYLALSTSSPLVQAEPHNFTATYSGGSWIFESTTVSGYQLAYSSYFKSLTSQSSTISLFRRGSAVGNFTSKPQCCQEPATALAISSDATNFVGSGVAHLTLTGGNGKNITWTTTGGVLSEQSNSGATLTLSAAGVYTVTATQADDETDPDNVICGAVVAKNITVKAQHTITFITKDNGITDTYATMTVTDGETYTMPDVSDEYDCGDSDVSFAGWVDDLADTEAEAAPGSDQTATANKTWYAAWSASSTTETVDLYELVTSPSSLSAGDKVLITNSGKAFAMAEQRDNNRGQVAIIENPDNANQVYFTTSPRVFTIGKSGDYFTFQDPNEDDKYLYAASTSSNHLKSESTVMDDSKWTITISDGVASIVATNSSNRNVMQHNSSSKIFSCYASASQQALSIFKRTGTTKTITVASSGVVTNNTTCTKGAVILAESGRWITSSNGQKVKTVIPVTAKGFDDATTLSASSSNAKFAVTLAATAVPSGSTGLTTNMVVEYTPTSADTKENTTITLTAGDKTKTITVNGRSLPDEFVIIAKKSVWYALPGNMKGANQYDGVEVTTDDAESPTLVPAAPSTIIYSLQSVASSRYEAAGNCVRLVGYGGKCLWSNASSGTTTIQDWAQLASATSSNYEWLLSTSNGDVYTIANPAHPNYPTRVLGFGSQFGMYSGAYTFYIVPVGCSSMPGDVEVAPRRVDATFSWVSNTTSMQIDVTPAGGGATISQTFSSSPAYFTGLAETTDYTFVMTPDGNSDCSYEGEFSTSGPTVDVIDWEENAVIIQVDKSDDLNPWIIIAGEHEEGVESSIEATELFFSKYFEGAGSMKLIAIFNGTRNEINLSDYSFKELHAGTSATSYGSTTTYDLTSLGTIKAGQEIIFFTRPKDECSEQNLYACSQSFLNSVASKSSASDNPRWIECNGTPFSSLIFNGNDAMVLYKNSSPIDVIGALNDPAQATVKNCRNQDNETGWAGTVTNMDYGKTIADYPGITLSGSETLEDYGINTTDETLSITTARVLLFRAKVESGMAAAHDNTATFSTFTASEWNGRSVCTSKDRCEAIGWTYTCGGSTYKDNSGATCNSYQDLGEFDYNNYYKEYVTIGDETALNGYKIEGSEDEYRIPVDNMKQYACLNMKFQLTQNGNANNVLTEQIEQVPIVVTTGTATTADIFAKVIPSDTDPYTLYDESKARCANCNVVVLNGATLTKAADDAEHDVPEVRNIKVYAGGKLVVPSGTEYTVNSLSLRREEDAIPEANIQGTLNIAEANGVYMDLKIDPTNWHYVSLPYDCNIDDVTFSNGIPASLGTEWLCAWYDGEYRAANKTGGWTDMQAGEVMKKGHGYIVSLPGDGKSKRELRFPMAKEVIGEELSNKTISDLHAWGGDDDELRPNHKGWNLIGNPYLVTYNNTSGSGTITTSPLMVGTLIHDNTVTPWDGTWIHDPSSVSSNLRYIVRPINNGWSGYEQTTINNMEPFTAYFIQMGGNTPSANQSVTFNAARAKRSIVRRAPAEYEEDDQHPVWYGLDLVNGNGDVDRTAILVSNQFTDNFDMMDDLIKQRGSYYQYYSYPVIASRNKEGEMAFNALPDSSAAITGVPLNYFAASAGTYTIRTDSRYDLEEVKSAILYDKVTNTRTDLLENDYTFETVKGDNTDRFTLFVRVERKKAPEVATGCDNLLDGQLSLIAIDRTLVLSGLTDAADIYVYDISGKLINGSHTQGGIWRATVPSQGVYFVRVNSAGGQQTLRTIVK